MRSTPLERALLTWFRDAHPALADLDPEQVAAREHSGAGCYVHLNDDRARDWDRPPLQGPRIRSPRLEADGECLLWCSGGTPDCLEIYAFGSRFPEDLRRFSIEAP